MLRQNGLNQDELLQAALELELWQERQREIFRAQVIFFRSSLNLKKKNF